MEYTYIIENQANKEIQIGNIDILYILCYHITTEGKYPFLQFMMNKLPFCNNLVKEQFILPYILFDKSTHSYELLILDKIKKALQNVGCNGNRVSDNMYKGIIYDNSDIPYALVNITDIDIFGLSLSRTTDTWFILPSEIINTTEVCNIPVDDMVIDLFTKFPELGILKNNKTHEPYMLPDAVYTGGEHKNVVFNSVFGNAKTKEYCVNSEYYYFYRSFNDAIKDGGWNKYGGTQFINRSDKLHFQSPSNRLLVDNEYGRYIKGGINRYALFPEGKIHIEIQRELSLSEKEIEMFYPEPVITICYSNEHEIKPDVLVKEYDYSVSLSYHILDKSLLGEKYISENNKSYMIL